MAVAPEDLDTLGKVRAEVREALESEDRFGPAQCDDWITRLDTLYQRDPGAYTVALLDAGRIARTCDRPANARVHYKRAATEGPEWIRAEAALGIAQTHRMDGALADVERSLRRALRRNPTHVEARLMLVRVLLERHADAGQPPRSRTATRLGRPPLSEAMVLCRTQIEADPRRHEARVLLARALLLADDPERRHYIATRTLLEPVQKSRDPKVRAESMLVVGLAALRSRDENVALRHFERALSVDPDQAEAAGRAALILVKVRAYGRALELLAVALSTRRFTDDPALLEAQALAYTQLNQHGRAQRVRDRLRQLGRSTEEI